MDAIPHEIKEFIQRYIRSIEELEVLIFLLEHQEAAWTVKRLNDTFVSSTASLEKRLQGLQKQGFLVLKDPAARMYSYVAPTKELDDRLRQVADYYRKHRYTLIDYIFRGPVDKIRDFADAFKLKEEDDDR